MYLCERRVCDGAADVDAGILQPLLGLRDPLADFVRQVLRRGGGRSQEEDDDGELAHVEAGSVIQFVINSNQSIYQSI